MDKSATSDVADLLVKTRAVAFRTEPFFRFTSGTTSPVYVDNRQLLGHVAERERVVDQLVERAEGMLDSVQAIAGTATAGIPWAAWIAARTQKPLLYVRSQAKDWGRERAVEGTAVPGARVLVVEDLAFTAGSLITAAENLREADLEVQDALAIVSYETPVARTRMRDSALRLHSLTTIDDALAAAARRGSLDGEQVEIVEKWLRDIRATEPSGAS